MEELAAGNIVIVIPAYNPDGKLPALVREIAGLYPCAFLIVDDGSAPASGGVFQALEAEGHTVLRHPRNLGKGAAIKTALRHVLGHWPDAAGCVTADADGQHGAADVVKVAAALLQEGGLVLGARCFEGRGVPFKSKWGNRITSSVFYLQTGIRHIDTQTGLRGIPRELLGRCAEIEGDRFEYEMNVLLQLAKEGVPLRQVPIRTVYAENNRGTSFSPVRDSARIYGKILAFSLSSLVCAAIDVLLFALFRVALFPGGADGILYAAWAARILSGACNFCINRSLVFHGTGSVGASVIKYALLFVFNMLVSGFATRALSSLGLAEVIAKILVDSGLFVLSFFVQKTVVFQGQGGRRRR
ncbi:MAG: bifunctional glycosyltransferase family 2/GtrA family protein [Clostridiales Family XIII bacterium]|jgi:glycosyltransferase involved in cell wall biosynthesis|nr:bifunctional glycosyltransferase family 2/GtrA family protein [Clostridiales Family XIII bacterium]